MQAALSISNLRKTFGATVALDKINLEVAAGSFVVLLGPSGCGKTTLLRIISGITQPTSGGITLQGKEIATLPPEKRNFGMVFQNYALFPHLSVERNVAFGLEMRKIPKPEIAWRVTAALNLVGLGEQAKRFPKQLSGGQQQRVSLARAIVIEPDVILFDEPLSNLDAKLRESLREDLRNLQNDLGVTSIYVTHDQTEAMALADKIVIIREGRIVEQGTPLELYRLPVYRFTAEFLGMTNVLDVKVQDGICQLPWGARRPVVNAGQTDAEGIAIRPEDLRLEPTEDADADGVVTKSMFIGASTHYWIETAGINLRSIAPGGSNSILADGQKVRLSLPKSLHLLKSERALAEEKK